MAKSYKYSNKGITSFNGKDKIRIQAGAEVSEETRHIFTGIMNSVDFKVNDDSIQGFRLANSIEEAEGQDFIEIGEGVYDWLQKKLKEINREGREICATLFRQNGCLVEEFIKNGYEKPHQPTSKKKGKEEKDAPETEASEE